MNPKTCTGSDCTSALSYQLDGDVIHFELMGVAEGYVSVGFSEDDLMVSYRAELPNMLISGHRNFQFFKSFFS